MKKPINKEQYINILKNLIIKHYFVFNRDVEVTYLGYGSSMSDEFCNANQFQFLVKYTIKGEKPTWFTVGSLDSRVFKLVRDIANHELVNLL